jgi:DNA-binding NarL/FixJ family response regulator
MDGLKLLSLLKGNDPEMSEFSKWKNIPVILLTAKSLTPDRITGYKLGAQAYLSKPFSPDELLSIIDNLIRRRVEQSNTNLDSKSLDTLKDDLKDIKSLLQTSSSQDRKVLDVDYGKEGVYPSTAAQLTPTEIEVLSLLCDGFSNSEIALKRGKSPIGIGKTISKLYLKTQTKTRTELVRWAVQTGLVK